MDSPYQNDFGLWRLKMRALLVYQEIVDTLKGGEAVILENLTFEKKREF